LHISFFGGHAVGRRRGREGGRARNAGHRFRDARNRGGSRLPAESLSTIETSVSNALIT
jgi:hypothetical protein